MLYKKPTIKIKLFEIICESGRRQKEELITNKKWSHKTINIFTDENERLENIYFSI